MDKGQIGMGGIIMMFIGIIVIVAAFIPTIFDTQNTMTDKQSIVNEVQSLTNAYNTSNVINETGTNSNITITNAPSGWKVSLCPIENVVITNASGTTLTVSDDYTVDASTGTIKFKNTAATNLSTFASGGTNNDSYISYDYCADGYNTEGSSRTMASLIGLFSVLALLAFVILYVKFNY